MILVLLLTVLILNSKRTLSIENIIYKRLNFRMKLTDIKVLREEKVVVKIMRVQLVL
jgi:hypothetical protein